LVSRTGVLVGTVTSPIGPPEHGVSVVCSTGDGWGGVTHVVAGLLTLGSRGVIGGGTGGDVAGGEGDLASAESVIRQDEERKGEEEGDEDEEGRVTGLHGDEVERG
jgi:hypothetical protein